MSDKKPEDKIKKFSALTGGKKAKEKKTPPKARHQIYVDDARFKHAMDLIQKDMDNALELGSIANTQQYFLVKFLAKKGLLKEDEFAQFVQEELSNMEIEDDDI